MAKKSTCFATLANNVTVGTGQTAWIPEEIYDVPVLLQGWQAGKGSHIQVSMGLCLAAKDVVDNAYLGDFEAERPDGTTVLIPVVDPIAVQEEMERVFVEHYGLDVPVFSRRGSSPAMKKAFEELAQVVDEEVIAALKANGASPELIAKLAKLK